MKQVSRKVRIDPSAIHLCKKCCEEIYHGDEYAKVDEEIYCNSCLEDMSAKELVLLFGGEWKIADEDELDDGSDDAYESWKDEVLFG